MQLYVQCIGKQMEARPDRLCSFRKFVGNFTLNNDVTLSAELNGKLNILLSILGFPPGALFPHPHSTNPNALSQRSIFSEHPATPGSGSITLPGSIDSKYSYTCTSLV